MNPSIEIPVPSDSPLRLKAKTCLVGEPAVGKTSLIRRFMHNQFEGEYVSTLGVHVSAKPIVVSKQDRDERVQVDMTVWDIMGARGFRELLQEAYFHGARGILAVCDVTREGTCGELDAWLSAVRRVTGPLPVRVLANKVDLADSGAVTEEDLRALSEKYGGPHYFTSAKTGQNVEAAFESLAAAIVEEESRKRVPAGEGQRE